MSAYPNVVPGAVFNRLTVIERTPNRRSDSKLWACRCECGTTLDVTARRLANGHLKSCGCLLHDFENYEPHGPHSHGHCQGEGGATPTYRSWRAMMNRCNPATKVKGYQKHYVRKGVKVCERWRSFEAFLEDMGERPAGKTLDRYPDPAGNYEPGNCRWATTSEQNLNKRGS